MNMPATLLTLFAAQLGYVGDTKIPRCDDGQPVIFANGSINSRCIIDGCSITDQFCWDYKLSHCYDAAGDENGECVLRDKTCNNSLSCAWQFAVCSGSFECIKDNDVGLCAKGICIEDASDD